MAERDGSEVSDYEAEENPFEIASDVVFSEKVRRRDDTMTFIGSGDEHSHNESSAKAKSGVKPSRKRKAGGLGGRQAKLLPPRTSCFKP